MPNIDQKILKGKLLLIGMALVLVAIILKEVL